MRPHHYALIAIALLAGYILATMFPGLGSAAKGALGGIGGAAAAS
jgi:hypothetical protein